MAKILLVDDEPVLRLTFRRFLEEEGHHVVVAASAAEAADAMQRVTVDLLITDLVMPGGGMELVSSARQRHVALPIIVMSGEHRSLGELASADAAGMTVLEKPADRAALMWRVRSLIRELNPA